MAITAAQLTEYLTAQGVTLPAFVVTAVVDLANNSDLAVCMEANGYPESAKTMVGIYLGYLFGLANFGRYITSQSAPNGASRSFSTPQMAEAWRGTLAALRAFDPKGCVTDLLPADPTRLARAWSYVATADYGQ